VGTQAEMLSATNSCPTVYIFFKKQSLISQNARRDYCDDNLVSNNLACMLQTTQGKSSEEAYICKQPWEETQTSAIW